MPLIKSPKPKAISENIATEMDAGRPQGQAVAIAEDEARRAVAAGAAPSTPTPKATGHHYNPIRSKKP